LITAAGAIAEGQIRNTAAEGERMREKSADRQQEFEFELELESGVLLLLVSGPCM
jgi:hypothetical protein